STPERAIQTALRLLSLDPLQEAAHRALMRLYARHGRRASALRQYQVCVEVLQRELGVEPEPETRRVYQDILQQSSMRSVLPDPRIGSPARPGPGRRPTRRDASSVAPPLVGRRPETARLHEAVHGAAEGRGGTVVILGEAGIGKTRLLDELAAAVLRAEGRVVVGRCYETEQILPFGPWVEALRTGLGALPRGAL